MADELKGVVRASVVAATNLSKTNINKIQASLAKKTGKTVVLDVQKDTSLIGGIITKIGDLVLDGSVKTQLINMRETLKKGESL
jgi:F-type H+-transporting ATPase subunit delta